jgi:hypothetical protein
MRALVVCLLLVGALGTLGVVATRAQGEPSISVSPQEGPPGTVVTVSGEGFIPGDTVYIDVTAVLSRGGGTVRLATVTVDAEGGFRITAEMRAAGTSVYREFNVMAYAHSFGNRSVETIAAAPKAVFTVTPSVLPPSGVGVGVGHEESARGWALAALGLAAAFGGAAAVVFMSAPRRA